MEKKEKWIPIIYHVYEMGKKDPVAVILANGHMVDLDPWDVEEMKKIGQEAYLKEGEE